MRIVLKMTYLLSIERVQNDAVISRSLTYLSKLNNLYVTTPMGQILSKPRAADRIMYMVVRHCKK